MTAYLIRIFLTSGEHIDIGPMDYDNAEKSFTTFQEGITSGASYTVINGGKERTYIRYDNVAAIKIVATEITEEDKASELKTWG